MNFIQPSWPAPMAIKAYTTLRNSWGSREANDDATLRESSLKTLLQLPTSPIWLTQTHSAIAIEASPTASGQIADAAFTTTPKTVCIVLTADCLPVLICNKQGTKVAAIHAGWRGLAGGIIEATLAALQEASNNLLVWLGPAIGPQKFEVGEDVYTAFVSQHKESGYAFSPINKNKWFADLYALAKIRLKRHGVDHVYGGNYCTFSQDHLFFSYRRDRAQAGRMASVIWING